MSEQKIRKTIQKLKKEIDALTIGELISNENILDDIENLRTRLTDYVSLINKSKSPFKLPGNEAK